MAYTGLFLHSLRFAALLFIATLLPLAVLAQSDTTAAATIEASYVTSRPHFWGTDPPHESYTGIIPTPIGPETSDSTHSPTKSITTTDSYISSSITAYSPEKPHPTYGPLTASSGSIPQPSGPCTAWWHTETNTTATGSGGDQRCPPNTWSGWMSGSWSTAPAWRGWTGCVASTTATSVVTLKFTMGASAGTGAAVEMVTYTSYGIEVAEAAATSASTAATATAAITESVYVTPSASGTAVGSLAATTSRSGAAGLGASGWELSGSTWWIVAVLGICLGAVIRG